MLLTAHNHAVFSQQDKQKWWEIYCFVSSYIVDTVNNVDKIKEVGHYYLFVNCCQQNHHWNFRKVF